MNAKTESNPNETCETIKLGIDAHAKWFYVGRQVDGATPQPVQKMSLEGLLRFVAKQKRLARDVFTCYEAGPFGYHLHRQLTEMGVTNYVVQPQVWDERHKGVKTDKLDALALCERLDRFVWGNRKAFSIVRVPTEEEERERALSRQRQQLMRERQRLQAMGRSLLSSHGIHVTGRWWKGATWEQIQDEAPDWVIERLEVFIRLITPVEAEERELTEAIEEGATDKDPQGSRAVELRGAAARDRRLVTLQQPARSLQLHRPVSPGTQQRWQATKRQYQQERQPESAGDAGGDGLANDALATRLPRPEKVGAGAGEPKVQRGGPKEGGRGRRPTTGRRSVEAVHRPDHRRETRADLFAGSGVNPGDRCRPFMI